MAKVGYARVPARGQNDDSQVDDLTACGCEKIFTDTASGKNAARPELDKALAYLRAGDVFVITRLSRAMRSLKHLLALAEELRGAVRWRALRERGWPGPGIDGICRQAACGRARRGSRTTLARTRYLGAVRRRYRSLVLCIRAVGLY